jgi:hypothetical protein
MRIANIFVVAILNICVLTACTFGRSNMADLAKEQDNYYSDLNKLLVDKRSQLVLSLANQIKVDMTRGVNLLDWKHDLAKAEVLLNAGSVQGKRKLLFQKMADINLGWTNESDEHAAIAQSETTAILNAYDNVTKGIEGLRTNNEIILKYLSTNDATFLLRNLDIPALARLIVAAEESKDELRQVKTRSEEEHRKDLERREAEIERARNILMNVFAK